MSITLTYKNLFLTFLSFIKDRGLSNSMKKNKRVTISVNNDVDLLFRKLASSKMLFETGWYSSAIEEAMVLWIEKEKKKLGNI